MDHTSLDWGSAALVVIDVQNDFVNGAMPVPGTAAVLPRLSRLLDAFRRAGMPIVHAVRLYEPGSSDVDPVRREAIEQGARIVAPGTRGAQIPRAVTGRPVTLDTARLLAGEPQAVSATEVILHKPRWSAFHRTGLQAWLSDRDVTSVLVAGCNLPNCPRATLFDATERDLRAGVVTDAVSQTSPERLADLALIGVQQVTVDDVLAHLGQGRVHGPVTRQESRRPVS